MQGLLGSLGLRPNLSALSSTRRTTRTNRATGPRILPLRLRATTRSPCVLSTRPTEVTTTGTARATPGLPPTASYVRPCVPPLCVVGRQRRVAADPRLPCSRTWCEITGLLAPTIATAAGRPRTSTTTRGSGGRRRAVAVVRPGSPKNRLPTGGSPHLRQRRRGPGRSGVRRRKRRILRARGKTNPSPSSYRTL